MLITTVLDKASYWASIATMLGLTSAWFTFVASVAAENKVANEELRSLVIRLQTELDQISPWASGGEKDSGYLPAGPEALATLHPDWFNPSRTIYSFEYPTIRSLTANPLLTKIDGIQDPFLRLDHAITRLYELYREYRNYVLARPDLYSSTLQHLTIEPQGISDEQARFISHVFSYNRQIHQDLIGGRDSDDFCLYKTYRQAGTALERFVAQLPTAQMSHWYWFIHAGAIGLAIKAICLICAWYGL